MKKFILVIIVQMLIGNVIGQDFSKLDAVKFQTAQDYKKAESTVLECSNYLLNNPAKQNESNRMYAIQYILKWMGGTPDYTFSIGEETVELTKGDENLLPIYLAALTKTVLENPTKTFTENEMFQNAKELLVNYCSKPENEIKASKPIKKILKERNG